MSDSMQVGEAERVTQVALDERWVQGAGVLQGGVLAGVLSDAVDALMADLVDPGSRLEVETLDVRFERPAYPGLFVVRARLTQRGRTLLAFEARLVDSTGTAVATTHLTHRVRGGGA